MKIDCKTVATKWKNECIGVNASLAIVQVGDNPASNSYIKGKIKDCEEIGFNPYHHKLDENISEENLLKIIHNLNNDDKIDGIIVQLPLPKHISVEKVTNTISPSKDVDGFIYSSKFTQCTPLGVVNLLEELKVDLTGKFVVVLGRSENVGKKVADLCLEKNATVCICHSKTPCDTMFRLLSMADIVISAVGKANLFSWENVKKNSIVIDIGINRNENGKLCGDFVPPEDETYCDYTTVPGGIGLLTRAMLMKNTYFAHSLNNKK